MKNSSQTWHFVTFYPILCDKCYPKPTSKDIITTKPTTAPHDASLPCPLKHKQLYIII
jgi:hypothetical protein